MNLCSAFMINYLNIDWIVAYLISNIIVITAKILNSISCLIINLIIKA